MLRQTAIQLVFAVAEAAGVKGFIAAEDILHSRRKILDSISGGVWECAYGSRSSGETFSMSYNAANTEGWDFCLVISSNGQDLDAKVDCRQEELGCNGKLSRPMLHLLNAIQERGLPSEVHRVLNDMHVPTLAERRRRYLAGAMEEARVDSTETLYQGSALKNQKLPH